MLIRSKGVIYSETFFRSIEVRQRPEYTRIIGTPNIAGDSGKMGALSSGGSTITLFEGTVAEANVIMDKIMACTGNVDLDLPQMGIVKPIAA
jgi:hypothetical protein